MPKVLVLLAPGFEPIEASAPIDILRRAGCEVIEAAVGCPTLFVQGAHKVTIRADKKFDELSGSLFDAIVLPGGMPGAKNLADNPKVVAFIKNHVTSGRIVAAICASPGVVLAKACNVVRGKRACAYPGFDNKIEEFGGKKCDDDVVVDGKLITSRGPGTAMQFGIAIVGALMGQEKADTIRQDTLMHLL